LARTYLFFFLAGLANAALTGLVAVTGGAINGMPGHASETTVFKGVPYAAPPVGELRWKPPSAPARWTGARSADKFGADCIHPGKQAAAGSEDCLYLNVWTGAAAATERRPVLVIMAGAEGASGLDGEVLAAQGVVVVVANSRTGLMGFLAHPDLTEESEKKASGNYGLLDQIAVLGWVQRNIAAFGGDAKRVTLAGPFGALLAGSPLAKGMFVRAIATGRGEATALADAEKAGETFAQAENAHSMRFLRPMEAGDLVQATVDEHYSPGPVVDGWVLPADWQKAQSGVQVKPANGTLDLNHVSAAWLDFIRQ
jgi:carboxylesterase type B